MNEENVGLDNRKEGFGVANFVSLWVDIGDAPFKCSFS